ncbi:MAG: alpha/beta hydrolase [Lactobacillus sp.]|nr:alpha/beta hydrolase [Lactobacillus sp.]
MVLKTYQELLITEQLDASQVTLMGDSAGGGFILAFLQRLRDESLPLPKQAVLLSPWLDVTGSNPKMMDIQPFDPMLNLPNLIALGQGYIGDLNDHDPLVSPIYGDSANLPPIYSFTGTHDILNADALKFQDKADENNWDVTTYNYDNMNHVFSALPIPEGLDSLTKIATIIRQNQ